jgi:hypothetical protein
LQLRPRLLLLGAVVSKKKIDCEGQGYRHKQRQREYPSG